MSREREYIAMKPLIKVTANSLLEGDSERQPQKAFKHMTEQPILSLGDASTTSEIMKILEVLADGKWHMLDDVQQETRITRRRLQRILDFLSQYSFTITDGTGQKARLDKKAQDFLTQTSTP